MQQVKIFKGLEGEIAALEKQVNTWLVESGARVLQITGNIAAQGGSPDPQSIQPVGGPVCAFGYSPHRALRKSLSARLRH